MFSLLWGKSKKILIFPDNVILGIVQKGRMRSYLDFLSQKSHQIDEENNSVISNCYLLTLANK